MSYTLYDGTVPHALAAVRACKALLLKAEAHATSTSTPIEQLLDARLAPDMLPLTFQVHMITDTAQKLVARLHDVEPTPSSWPEGLKTLAEVRERLDATIAALEGAEKEKFVERTDAKVTFGMGPGKNAELKAKEYAAGYVVPNVFFHTAILYSILRKEGVVIGKMDYLTPFIGGYLA
ncbi:hypothetical protein ACHAQH_004976 [Verticillium albo-atrum]